MVKLDSPTRRKALRPRREPFWQMISKGQYLGYRRIRGLAGTWLVKQGRNRKSLECFADDLLTADGIHVLTFAQAIDKARTKIATESSSGDDAVPTTVLIALDNYEADLKTRGGDIANVIRIRGHLTEALAGKPVASLKARDLRGWRDGLAKKGLTPATVNRHANAFRAALNLAADHDERITNRSAWEIGLKSIPDAEKSRNVILPDAIVRQIIEAAREPSRLAEPLRDADARQRAEAEAERWAQAFGLLVEVAAVTGARISQLARLEVQDLQNGRADPRLMMPSSKKGRGSKKILRRPVPIPGDLAKRLERNAEGRKASDRLLLKPGGGAWGKSDHSRPFERAVDRVRERTGETLADVTLYALRHSSIVRMLLAGIPARVVAAHHDTSIAMIEKTYSAHIADHADTLARRALLDMAEPATGNVVPIAKAAS